MLNFVVHIVTTGIQGLIFLDIYFLESARESCWNMLGLNSAIRGKGQQAGFCEHDTEHSIPIKSCTKSLLTCVATKKSAEATTLMFRSYAIRLLAETPTVLS